MAQSASLYMCAKPPIFRACPDRLAWDGFFFLFVCFVLKISMSIPWSCTILIFAPNMYYPSLFSVENCSRTSSSLRRSPLVSRRVASRSQSPDSKNKDARHSASPSAVSPETKRSQRWEWLPRFLRGMVRSPQASVHRHCDELSPSHLPRNDSIERKRFMLEG